MDELTEAVERTIAARGDARAYRTAIDDLGILRSTGGRHPSHLVLSPTLCVVVRGAKQTTVGSATHTYRAGQALVVTVDVPGVSVITEAHPSAPYLSVVLRLDPLAMAEVLERLDAPPPASGPPAGVFVVDLDEPLADCVLRAVRLLDTPDAIPLLYPALQREVAYRLLTGPHGADVAAVAVGTGPTPGVARAVHALRDRYAETVRVDELAEAAGLSASAFHRRFKALTAMTPLQYQKRLRLLEARRLMLTDAVTAEAAAREVGYESASQFSREYARAFGAPPARDASRLRATRDTAAPDVAV